MSGVYLVVTHGRTFLKGETKLSYYYFYVFLLLYFCRILLASFCITDMFINLVISPMAIFMFENVQTFDCAWSFMIVENNVFQFAVVARVVTAV